jgi:MinD superfamily P-loop ATPase
VSEGRPAVIAVASGKGGTGKTTVAAHLALAGSRRCKTVLVDLDVEAPDSLGYFPNAVPDKEPLPVAVAVPHLLEERCIGCGACAKSCRFGAIFAIGGVVTIDERVCKGCGRCVAACPASALIEVDLSVGATQRFASDGLELLEGRMSIGDIRSTAVIETAKRRAEEIDVDLELRDCPPGVSCPATHAIEGSDYVVLVAEPTEFSLHDLQAAFRLVKDRDIPVGVVINKDGFGSADAAALCFRCGVPVIGRIAFSRARAESGATSSLWIEDGSFMAEMDRMLDAALAGARTGAHA